MQEVELTPEESHRKAAKERKLYAIENKETIVFAMEQDQHGNYIVVTLENPYMMVGADTKEKAIRNAFEAYETYLDNLIKIKSSGDTEVSQ